MNTLALVMIARDEARCIERCLASVRGVVDHLLVLDTGSRDDTVARARRAGAEVGHFEWVHDFSAARNAALEWAEARTPAAWHLVLDADEWLADGADALAALRHGQAGFLGQVCVDSSFDGPAGAASAAGPAVQHAPSWLPRVLPRGVRYAGLVHEQPQSALPRQRLAVRVGHDGYRQAQLAAKQGRNAALLSRALAASPQDGYLHYQHGKDLQAQGQVAAAAPAYARAEPLTGRNAAWRHDLVVRLIFAWKVAREFERALHFAEAEMPHWPHSPDFFFTLGDLLLDWAATEPARAGELLPMIEASWLRALEIGERPALADSVRGRGSHLAAHNLGVLCAGTGRPAEAQQWRERAAAMAAGATG